jgi:HSP20 family molecular chaperone IbpA
LHQQLNRVFGEGFGRGGEVSNLTTWAPGAVGILENEHELVVKANVPDVDPKVLDIRVENNI